MSRELAFQGIQKLYNKDGLYSLSQTSVAIIGVGGVGSWAAEILARSAIGSITLIDLDEICISNMNRQIHTLSSTIGKSKVLTLKARLDQLGPYCKVSAVETFLETNNIKRLVDHHDYVLDAIDSINPKVALIDYCIKHKKKIISTGAAGGKTDPSQVKISDLGFTQNDRLLKRVRRELRRGFAYPKNKVEFGVKCAYSSEKIILGEDKLKLGKLDCQNSLGSAGFVTGAIGFAAASIIVNDITSRPNF